MAVVRFPQYLSSPLTILWFEADEIGIFFIALAMALIFGGWFFTLSIIGAPWVYRIMKAKFPKGFLRHVFYMAGFLKMHGYPHYFEDKFNE